MKLRSSAKQALEARMWRQTQALLRNSPRLERWPVDVQLTQTKRVAVLPQWIGGQASGQALDAITATSNRVRTSRMPVIALRAKWLTQRLERVVWDSWTRPPGRAGPASVPKNSAGHLLASCNHNACARSASLKESNSEVGRGNGCWS